MARSVLRDIRDGGINAGRLHSQATTTPKVRAEIQASDEAAWILAERHGTTEQVVHV